MSTTDPGSLVPRGAAAGVPTVPRAAAVAEARARAPRVRHRSSIVPRDTIAGSTLVAVVAIMTFLASLTIGAALAVRATASQWRFDVTREVTIQIRAGDRAATDAQVELAASIARATPGIADAHVLSPDETGRLLEPWLGAGLNLDDLPVPRVVVLKLDGSTPVDFARLRRVLNDRIPTSSLDDHRLWSRRLGAMAEGATLAGFVLVGLVGLATMLSVVFATRAAVATNRAVVEVLHFVGARDGFIAAQFQRHFLKIGAEGGLIGGGGAAAVFGAIILVPRFGLLGAPDDPSLFGWLDPGWWGFAGIGMAVVVVALATALTSRITVYRTLRTIQ